MLSKENRLKKQKDFENIFKKGEGFFGKFLVLKKTENNLKKARVGFVVSQKVSKKATARNKLKRRLREITRKSLPQTKKGCDIVFFAKKGAADKDSQGLKKEVEKLLFKAGLLENDSKNN